MSVTGSVLHKEIYPLICLDSDTYECPQLPPTACIGRPFHNHSMYNVFLLVILKILAYLPCTSLLSSLFSYSVYLLCVWSIILALWTTLHCTFLQVCLVFVNGGPECSTCRFLGNLLSGLIWLFSLFCIPVFIIPNSLLAFLAATYDWSDIFIELSVITSNFLYGMVICGLESITVYLKLDCFLNGHLFFIDWQRIL